MPTGEKKVNSATHEITFSCARCSKKLHPSFQCPNKPDGFVVSYGHGFVPKTEHYLCEDCHENFKAMLKAWLKGCDFISPKEKIDFCGDELSDKANELMVDITGGTFKELKENYPEHSEKDLIAGMNVVAEVDDELMELPCFLEGVKYGRETPK